MKVPGSILWLNGLWTTTRPPKKYYDSKMKPLTYTRSIINPKHNRLAGDGISSNSTMLSLSFGLRHPMVPFGDQSRPSGLRWRCRSSLQLMEIRPPACQTLGMALLMWLESKPLAWKVCEDNRVRVHLVEKLFVWWMHHIFVKQGAKQYCWIDTQEYVSPRSEWNKTQ